MSGAGDGDGEGAGCESLPAGPDQADPGVGALSARGRVLQYQFLQSVGLNLATIYCAVTAKITVKLLALPTRPCLDNG